MRRCGASLLCRSRESNERVPMTTKGPTFYTTYFGTKTSIDSFWLNYMQAGAIRRCFKWECTLGLNQPYKACGSSFKLLKELLGSPLNDHSRQATSDLSIGLYRGCNWGHIICPNVLNLAKIVFNKNLSDSKKNYISENANSVSFLKRCFGLL